MSEWFRLLKVCRTLPLVFTAQDLANEARILPGTKKSPDQKYQASGTQKASAYLAKFAKLGYVRRVGVAMGEGRGNHPTLYEITSFGKAYEAGTGGVAALLAAILAFEKARGLPGEERAYKAMLKAAEFVAEEEKRED